MIEIHISSDVGCTAVINKFVYLIGCFIFFRVQQPKEKKSCSIAVTHVSVHLTVRLSHRFPSLMVEVTVFEIFEYKHRVQFIKSYYLDVVKEGCQIYRQLKGRAKKYFYLITYLPGSSGYSYFQPVKNIMFLFYIEVQINDETPNILINQSIPQIFNILEITLESENGLRLAAVFSHAVLASLSSII